MIWLLRPTGPYQLHLTKPLVAKMHIARGDLVQSDGAEGETILSYPTASQPDVMSLERFQIRTRVHTHLRT